MTLNSGPIPLYHQLAEDLRGRIVAGELAPGDPLPTEEMLCRQYGVSRITVRRGLDDLFNAGLIVRRRGVGSFVAERSAARSTSLVGSLYDALAYPRDIRIEVLRRAEVAASHRVAEELGLAPGSEVMQLDVLSRIEDAPFAATVFFFPPDIGAGIASADLRSGTPVAHLVERRLGEAVVRASQTVEPEQAGSHVARLLQIPARTAILHVRRTYFSASQRPVEHVSVRYHPDRYRLRVDLLPGQGG